MEQARELGVGVGEAQPGYSVSDAEGGDPLAEGGDLPGDFAAQRDRFPGIPDLAYGRQRHPDRLGPDQQLPGSRLGSVGLLGDQRSGPSVDLMADAQHKDLPVQFHWVAQR
ncbi:hypothetical protein SALBM311S_10427 [Streptomyces alboniger]